jgi:hypothetical protein
MEILIVIFLAAYFIVVIWLYMRLSKITKNMRTEIQEEKAIIEKHTDYLIIEDNDTMIEQKHIKVSTIFKDARLWDDMMEELKRNIDETNRLANELNKISNTIRGKKE